MSKKYYVVWKGHKTGVFDNWPEAKAQVEGRKDAQYMGFASKQAAEKAFKESYTKALMKRSQGDSAKAGTSQSAATDSGVISARDPDIQIYTDGACSPNPGKSGTGVAIFQKKDLKALWYGLYQANGTNNTAELNGLLVGFKFAEKYLDKAEHVEILSDSKYSIDCITKWAKGWQAKGWTRGKGEEIKNLELIKECFALYQKLKGDKLSITYVKGHANIEGNELADRMAVQARLKQEQSFVRYTQESDIKAILALPSG